MASLTKAQLVAQLEAAHVSYEALSAKYEALLSEQHRVGRRPATTTAVSDLSEYRQACAAAKALALRTGRCVSVAR